MRYLRSTHSAIVGKVTQHLHFWLFSRTAPVCTQDSHLHNSRAECPSWLALLRSLPKQPVLSTFKGGQLFCVHDSCVHRPRLIPGLEFRMFSLSVLFRSRSRTGAFRRRQRQRKKHVEEVRHDILPLQQRFHNGSPITGGELLRNQDEDGRKCIFKDISHYLVVILHHGHESRARILLSSGVIKQALSPRARLRYLYPTSIDIWKIVDSNYWGCGASLRAWSWPAAHFLVKTGVRLWHL